MTLSPSMMVTGSGVIDLDNPKPHQINFFDITQVLSRTLRWAGRSRLPVSVAMHTLNGVSMASPEARPYWLLHDAHGAYIGDIPTPVKNAIKNTVGKGIDPVGVISRGLDLAIWAAAGLAQPSAAIVAEIELIDEAMLNFEREHYGLPQHDEWPLSSVHPALLNQKPLPYRPEYDQQQLFAAILAISPNWGKP